MNFPSWHVLIDPSCRAYIPLDASGSRGVKAGEVWFKQQDAVDPCCQAPQMMRNLDWECFTKKGNFLRGTKLTTADVDQKFPQRSEEMKLLLSETMICGCEFSAVGPDVFGEAKCLSGSRVA